MLSKAWANRDAQMHTATIDAFAYGFAWNYGYSTAGGTDEARFYDSPGDDTFTVKAYANQGSMSGPGFYNYASGFARYYGYSTAGGSDFSRLSDSKGDDVYKAWANRDAQMDTATIDAFSYGFAWNYGYSTAGGANDVAYLYDSSGDDTFVAKPAGSLRACIGRSWRNRPRLPTGTLPSALTSSTRSPKTAVPTTRQSFTTAIATTSSTAPATSPGCTTRRWRPTSTRCRASTA